ncbi:thiamine ABC transporter ATP-binding protein ThiQ [Candidatus Liberibacter brunswickensis]|uniref:thiamine ABC transporter ATP-binding protein ThiQ n=1 Tax=Candidatus Liberibacter brunswickensis TaxID=1968796 RepID=UPI002FE1A5E6
MRFDFQVNQNERIVILGPSGAGKSTLLSLIAGFLYSKQGNIYLNKQNHTLSSPSKRPLSILFQENNLFPHLTVWQNIALGVSPNLHLDNYQYTKVKQIIEKFFLDDCFDRLPSQISGGQRQRSALARCFIRQKPILLLDEPFAVLDPSLRNEILGLLKKLCDERQLTLLMVSHNLEDAVKIATRFIVISEGKIVYDGNPDYFMRGLIPESAILGINAQNI